MSETIEEPVSIIDSTEVTDNTEIKILTDYTVAKKLIQLKQSADSRSLEFSLKFTTVKKLMNSKKCFYTGKTFEPSGIYARSIDRIDPSKGYLDDNVVACTVDINGKKSNLTINDIHCLSKKIQQHYKNKI
jgi:hypothetical protein